MFVYNYQNYILKNSKNELKEKSAQINFDLFGIQTLL